jgi:hypothetical protein
VIAERILFIGGRISRISFLVIIVVVLIKPSSIPIILEDKFVAWYGEPRAVLELYESIKSLGLVAMIGHFVGDQDNYKQDLSDLKRINIDIFLSSKISALA